MAAFLYISSGGNARLARRVDFGNIASLFGEVDAPTCESRARQVLRFVAALLFVFLAIGDTVLVSRPDALRTSAVETHHILAAQGRPLTL